jgi:hypothetical protein
MKKIRITENELVDLIEKLVKENLGNGIGQIFPLMGAPTDKYKDLLEKEDIEEDDGEEEQLNVDITDQPGSDDEDAWMEGIEESKLISRLKRSLNEDKKWIQKAYASGDVKKDKLTDYCNGKVTCECVERALKSKDMKKGAQMYLNMNKSKCKSLQD